MHCGCFWVWFDVRMSKSKNLCHWVFLKEWLTYVLCEKDLFPGGDRQAMITLSTATLQLEEFDQRSPQIALFFHICTYRNRFHQDSLWKKILYTVYFTSEPSFRWLFFPLSSLFSQCSPFTLAWKHTMCLKGLNSCHAVARDEGKVRQREDDHIQILLAPLNKDSHFSGRVWCQFFFCLSR